ncbi:hypothetical protein [Streptomyces sp. NPDC060322]
MSDAPAQVAAEALIAQTAHREPLRLPDDDVPLRAMISLRRRISAGLVR